MTATYGDIETCRQRMYIYLHTNSYVLCTDTRNLCPHDMHVAANIGDSVASRRHVADMLPTFAAKIPRRKKRGKDLT